MTSKSHIVTASEAGTLDGLFRERVRRSPDLVAYCDYDRASGAWQALSWADMAHRVGRWRAALRREDLSPGDRVALVMRNCPDWVAFEQAALGLGLVVVPLYVEDRADNVCYILNDAGVKVLLLEDERHWRRLAAEQSELKALQRIVIDHARGNEAIVPADERLRLCSEWLPLEPDALAERGGDPNDLATIVYTSGTTGRPKGVMLSHRNILSNADAAARVFDAGPGDVMLSFLPLSHTFERTCGYYLMMMAGCTVTYARSVQQLADDLQQVHPTIMISVPRVFERVHDKLQAQLEKKSFVARLLFNLTVRVGWRRFLVAQGRARSSPILLLWPLLHKLVATQVAERLGGRVRLAVSGGAALPFPIARTFVGLGVPILQGYGMTESSPVVAANLPHANKPESVGVPLPGVEIRVGANDELLVKGPNVMLGYWNNHKATREILEPDGWLHTGDQVRVDADGFIHITGRIKDILVLSNGEKIPPADMEAAITMDHLFDQAIVVGEGKPFLSAVVVLNAEQWISLAKANHLDPFDQTSLHDKHVHSALVAHMREALRDFPGYAKVRRVVASLDPWTLDNDLMTPTMKLKRARVIERFATEIEVLYEA